MMTTKEAIIEMIRKMPDDVTTADILRAVSVRYDIEESLRSLDRGEGVSHEEAGRRLARWLT